MINKTQDKILLLPIVIGIIIFLVLGILLLSDNDPGWDVTCLDNNNNIVFEAKNNSYVVIAENKVSTNKEEFTFPYNILSCHKKRSTRED